MTRGDNERDFAVLFVDDEEKAQKYFRMAYAQDFPVLTASNVAEALAVLEQRGDEIAVLITDQRMPGAQGVELLNRARQSWPAIVRILTTAYSDLENAIAAVNRGEILRYVTKPWDIEELRMELRQALDYFLLRRERDLLMDEKLGVRRSLMQSERLRGLLAIAAGLTRLRHAPQAVAAWLRDSLDCATDAPPAAADFEVWGLEIKQTLDLMTVHRNLRALDDLVEAGYPDRADLGELLRAAGLVTQGEAGEVPLRRLLVETMIRILSELAGHGATALLDRERDAQGNPATTIRIAGSEARPSPFTGRGSEKAADGGLLGSYLIAWHHGGILKAATSDGRTRFELRLPEEPPAVVLPRPDEEWLAEQFCMLEDRQ